MAKLHNAMHSFAKQFLPDLHHLPTHTGAKNALFFLGLFGFGTMMFSQVSANVSISTSLNNSVMTIEKIRVTTDGQTNSERKVELDPQGVRLNLGSPLGVLKRNTLGYITQGVVNGTDIDNGAIGSNHIQDGAIGANQIASGAIGSIHIASGAITCDKLNIPGFTCSGVEAPNGACPPNQFLQGINANGSYNCAPIVGGDNSLPDCGEGEMPIYENGGWGCQNLGSSENGDQLWEKLSFLSPHIYNKNRAGGRVGIGLTNPQTTLHVKGTFLVGRKGVTISYRYKETTYGEGGLNTYPGIQKCSCDEGNAAECNSQPDTNTIIQSSDVGQYCYDISDETEAANGGNGSSYGGGGGSTNWKHYIYERSEASNLAQLGESCGPNRLLQTTIQCDTGLTCVASPMADLPGTCQTTRAGCFIAETKITLADSSTKNIEDIKVGDKLKAVKGSNTVIALIRPTLGNQDIYAFNNQKAFFTANHPFLTTHGWKSLDPLTTKKEIPDLDVSLLSIGDTIISQKGNITVKSIQAEKSPTSTQLYNFQLDGDHTYFANGLAVHNKLDQSGLTQQVQNRVAAQTIVTEEAIIEMEKILATTTDPAAQKSLQEEIDTARVALDEIQKAIAAGTYVQIREGESCAAGNRAKDGITYACEVGTECVNDVCEKVSVVGESCGAKSGLTCKSGLVCIPPEGDGSLYDQPGTCGYAAAQAGETCGGGRGGSYIACATGLTCLDTAGNDPSTYDGYGTCQTDNNAVCGTLYAWRTVMGYEEYNKLNQEYKNKYGNDIPSCQCDTGNGKECGEIVDPATRSKGDPIKEMGIQFPQYGWDPTNAPWIIQDNIGDYCTDGFIGGKEPSFNIMHIVDQLGENCAQENACTNTGNFSTADELAVSDPNTIFYVGENAVGILTKTPQYTLDVVGTVRAAQVLTLSDARLKTNITPIGDALKKLMGIQGYIYDLKVDGSTQYGVLAQQVEEFFPYAVMTAENGLKSVNYSSLIAPMIQAIHELDSKVQTLEKTYQSNESRIQAIEEKLAK